MGLNPNRGVVETDQSDSSGEKRGLSTRQEQLEFPALFASVAWGRPNLNSFRESSPSLGYQTFLLEVIFQLIEALVNARVRIQNLNLDSNRLVVNRAPLDVALCSVRINATKSLQGLTQPSALRETVSFLQRTKGNASMEPVTISFPRQNGAHRTS